MFQDVNEAHDLVTATRPDLLERDGLQMDERLKLCGHAQV